MRRTAHRQQGFTLAEALMASVILTVAVAAVSEAIVSGQMQAYEAMHQQRAVMLVEEMLERVVALPYNDPQGDTTAGPDAGETTFALYDNADDYHGYSEDEGDTTDIADATFGDAYSRFARSVTAAYGDQSVSGFADPITGLTVTVTVTDDTGRTWVGSRFIAAPGS